VASFGEELLGLLAPHAAAAAAEGPPAAWAARGGGGVGGARGGQALSEAESLLLEALKEWRRGAAAAARTFPDGILDEPTLRRLAAGRPSQLSGPGGLEGVQGVNANVLSKFGPSVLAALAAAAQRLRLPLDAGRAAAEAAEAARRAAREAADAEARAQFIAMQATGGAGGGGGGGGGGSLRFGAACAAPRRGQPLTPAQQSSLTPWQQGASLAGAAAARGGGSVGTVVGHLLEAAAAGHELDWGRLAAELRIGAPGGLALSALQLALAGAQAATPRGEKLKLTDVRNRLPPGAAEAQDALRKGASWDAIRFAIGLQECEVAVSEPAPKRGREQPDLFGDAEEAAAAAAPAASADAVAAAVAAAEGGLTRAQLAQRLGERGLDAALEEAAGEDDTRVYEAEPGLWRAV